MLKHSACAQGAGLTFISVAFDLYQVSEFQELAPHRLLGL